MRVGTKFRFLLGDKVGYSQEMTRFSSEFSLQPRELRRFSAKALKSGTVPASRLATMRVVLHTYCSKNSPVVAHAPELTASMCKC